MAHESIYWLNTNDAIAKNVNKCSSCLKFPQSQPKGNIIAHKIQGKSWWTIGTDIFMFNNKNYLCIVDYYSKFPIVKWTEWLSADHPIKSCKLVFVEYELPKKYFLTLVQILLQRNFSFQELGTLQEHQILALLGADATAESYNSIIIVPRPNGTVHHCLNPVRVNQALIRQVHRRPTINDMLLFNWLTLMQVMHYSCTPHSFDFGPSTVTLTDRVLNTIH